MAPQLAVMVLVWGLGSMLLLLPMILMGRATGWTWLAVAWGAAVALLATVLLVTGP